MTDGSLVCSGMISTVDGDNFGLFIMFILEFAFWRTWWNIGALSKYKSILLGGQNFSDYGGRKGLEL